MADTVNKELIFKVLEYIETHPEEWDQDQWFCETTACFGGHALLLSGHGYRIVDTYVERPADAEGLEPLHEVEMVNAENQVIVDFSHRAAEVLGLPEDLADQIFDCLTVDPNELRRVVEGVVIQAETHAA